MIDFEAAADELQAQRPPTDEEIRGCAQIAENILRKQRELASTEQRVEDLKKEIARLEEITLPDAMKAARVSEFRLLDGSLVSVAQDIHPNIPSADSKKPELLARRAQCFAWLRANNCGDIIKNELKGSFGRGEDDKAAAFKAHAEELGVPVKQTETVAWQTLKATIADRIQKGKDMPLELFGTHVRNVATIEGPKKK
jgi:hypothetical protein